MGELQISSPCRANVAAKVDKDKALQAFSGGDVASDAVRRRTGFINARGLVPQTEGRTTPEAARPSGDGLRNLSLA